MATRSFIGILFFLSGFTGLVYEVIWAKYLALLLGSSAYAQVGVLALFMAGLALGSAFWGRRVDRSRRPLQLYGGLELGIAMGTASFALGFDTVSEVYWSALAGAENTGATAIGIKVLLCCAAMLLPTFCMGGTLPVAARALGLDSLQLGRGVAYLYALNSFGAAAGAVVTGFFLIPAWGLDAPFFAAALLNGLIGVVAIAAGRSPSATLIAEPAAKKGMTPISETEMGVIPFFDIFLIALAAATCGAVAMIYEVAWIRLCSLVFGSATYSFSVMLAAFIVGIALGSLVFRLVSPIRMPPLRFFAFTALASATVTLVSLPFYERLPFYAGRLRAILHESEASFATHQAATLLFCLVAMLPLTFTSGLSFPALAQAAARVSAGIGRPISLVLFANTVGSILGTVVGGLLLLPLVGLRGTFLLSAVLGALSGLVVLAAVLPSSRGVRMWIGGGAAALCAYALGMPGWDLRLLTGGEFRNHDGIGAIAFSEYRSALSAPLLFYADGASATVSVEKAGEDVVLRVNGKADASRIGDLPTELLSGYLPMILHPQAKRVLVIGHGSGITLGALLQHPIELVDEVEISPEVIAADAFFAETNHAALQNPRVRLHIEDARTFLYRTSERYDLIISEPSNPWVAGIGSLFSAEFFAQVRGRLAPGGMLLQWFHNYETSDGLASLVLRTVSTTFPEVRIFQPNRSDNFIVSSLTSSDLAGAATGEILARDADMASLGITHVSTVLGLEIMSDAQVRRLAGEGPLNRDRQPLLEYGAPAAFFAGRSSDLIARSGDCTRAGLKLSGHNMAAGEDQELAAYLGRVEMLTYPQMLPLLASWLARSPTDIQLLQALHNWTFANRDSPCLFSALNEAAGQVARSQRADYARTLLRISRLPGITLGARDFEVIAPILRQIAAETGEVKIEREVDALQASVESGPHP